MIVLVSIPDTRMYNAEEKWAMSTGTTISCETSHLGRSPYQTFLLYDIIPVSLNLRMLGKHYFRNCVNHAPNQLNYLILTSSLKGDLFVTPGPTGCFGM